MARDIKQAPADGVSGAGTAAHPKVDRPRALDGNRLTADVFTMSDEELARHLGIAPDEEEPGTGSRTGTDATREQRPTRTTR
jgi:hypothetical protein